MMPTRVILDGALLSECEMHGSNRHGMLRLAEDITRNIIQNPELEISFANTMYAKTYDDLLSKFILHNYPSHKRNILSKKPFFAPDRRILRYFSNILSLEVAIKDLNKNDIFHSFYYPFPELIQRKKIKKSITYLDIIPLRMDGYNEPLIHRTKRIVECIVPNFAISISAFSKEDLLDYDTRVDPAKVFVAPLAASKELFFQNRDVDKWQEVKRKYALPDNYFLSVSSNDLRKNIPHLIKSFANFVLQQKPKDLYLVLTGNYNYSRSILDELNISQEVKDRIHITEKYIENDDLSVVYSNCLCFFFMSLYEGFGLPVLEAMQCGTPVVTSGSTSLPELVGDAGVMLPPDDEDALCDAMRRMYEGPELRSTYSGLALHRARQFSWERCATEYAEIFRTIACDF